MFFYNQCFFVGFSILLKFAQVRLLLSYCLLTLDRLMENMCHIERHVKRDSSVVRNAREGGREKKRGRRTRRGGERVRMRAREKEREIYKIYREKERERDR